MIHFNFIYQFLVFIFCIIYFGINPCNKLKDFKQSVQDQLPSLPKISLPSINIDGIVPEQVQPYYQQIKLWHTQTPEIISSLQSMIIITSLLCLITNAYEYFAFIPAKILITNSAEEEFNIPYLWTMITSVYFDTKILYMVLNLVIINHFAREIDNIWSKYQFNCLIIFVAVSSGIVMLIQRYLIILFLRQIGYLILSDESYINDAYTSISSISLCIFIKINYQNILFGLRQNFPDKQFDTNIPFIKGNFMIPYQVLPQVYIGLLFFTQFLLEIQQDYRLLSSFYFTWMYLRFFMKNNLNSQQVGDQYSQHFALSTFFPEQLNIRERIEKISEMCQSISEKIRIIEAIQNCLRPPLQNKDPAVRKKALDNLDEEIKSLTKKGDCKNTDESDEDDEIIFIIYLIKTDRSNNSDIAQVQTQNVTHDTLQRRKNSNSSATDNQFIFNHLLSKSKSMAVDPDLQDLEKKIKEELRKD